MKKILWLLFILFGCQKMPIQKTDRNVTVSFQQTNVGASANDHSGDPLRTFAQKQNSNWTLAESTFGNIYTSGEVDAIINNDIQLDDAIIDPNVSAIIQDQIDASLASFSGGGSSASNRYILTGRVGDTGFPVAGDSLIINTGFVTHPFISFFIRDGNVLQQHTDNTQSDGFRFDGGTGTLTVRPVFGANEQIIIIAEEPVILHYLIAEGGSGGGGSPPDTPLLDSLLAVWEMDEVSGTTVIDALAVNNGTTNATVNQTGKLGKSKLYNGVTRSSIPFNSSLLPDGDELSISVWFYLTQLPSTAGHAMGLVRLCDAQTPYYTANVYLQTSNTIGFQVVNSGLTVYEFETAASAVTTGQWYHLVCVNEGAGENAKIYLNGTNVCTYHPTAFTGSLLQFDSVVRIGNNSDESEYGLVGYIDQVCIFKQALTGGLTATDDDIDLLYNAGTGKVYPFN